MKIEANGVITHDKITHGSAIRIWEIPQPATLRQECLNPETNLPPVFTAGGKMTIHHENGPPVRTNDPRLKFFCAPLEKWHVRAMHELLSRGFERCEYSLSFNGNHPTVKAFFTVNVGSLPAVGMFEIVLCISGYELPDDAGRSFAANMAMWEKRRREA